MRPHARNATALLPALSDLLDGQADRISADIVVRAAVEYCTAYLRRTSYARSWSFEHAGLRVEDVAFDILGELLADGEEGPCSALRHGMLHTLASHPEGDTPPLGAFRAVLITTVNQRIGRYFSACDPIRGKILARVRKRVARCDSLLSISAANGHWYLRPGRESTLHLPALPYEELLLLARAVFSADYFEFELLDSLLSALESLPQVRQAVSEADLVQMSVELLGRALEAEPERSNAPSEDRSPLLLIIDETIANFRPWLERKFIRPGKLSLSEAEAILRAGRIYLEDAMDGEPDSIYTYLSMTMPGLTRIEYRRDYHNRVGYILQRLFSTVGERVLSLQGNTVTEPGSLS